MRFILLFSIILFFMNACNSENVSLHDYLFNTENNFIKTYEDKNLLITAVLKPEELVAERSDNSILLNKPILEYFGDKLHVEFKIEIKMDNNVEDEANLIKDYGNNLINNVFMDYNQIQTFPAFVYYEKSALNKNTYTYMTVFEGLNLKTLFYKKETICLTIINHPFANNNQIQLCFDLKDIKI